MNPRSSPGKGEGLAASGALARGRRVAPLSRNTGKYLSPNPLQRWLLHCFFDTVGALCAARWPGPGGSVLDVGCGGGFALVGLHDSLPGARWHAVDPSTDAVRGARFGHPDAAVSRASGQHLPFSSAAFDAVLCLEVLEHVRLPRDALQELARVARGFVVLSVPNKPFFALANLLRGKNLSFWGEDPEHLHAWWSHQFLQMAGQVFDLEDVRHPFPWTVVVGTGRK